jgi:hypothetical protein
MRATVSDGVINLRFTLERGKAHRMVMTVAAGRERATFVQTHDGIFERLGGTRCWRRSGSAVPGPEGQMIELRGSRVLAPEPIGSLARLEVLVRDPATGKRTRIAYKSDPLTGRIVTMVVEGMAFNFRTLPNPPVIPSPKPRC